MVRSAHRMVDEVLGGRDADDRDADRSRTRALAPSEVTDSVKERARREARQQADLAREEVGRRAFELLEEYFPEQAKSRRRRDRLRTLVVGVAVGIIIHNLVSR